ncbi:MAG: bifunctional DNA primase/polymerase [Pseudonocardia sp.]
MTGPPSGHISARSGWSAQLRSVAMGLAGHGWPVLRGTYCDSGIWRGHPRYAGLCPVEDDWSTRWTVRVDEIVHWWSEQPYSVLVACGHGVDCVELPLTPTSHRMLGPLREAGLCPPAMRTPVGTLVLFVRTPTTALQPSMLVSVSLRSTGSWIAVPPTDHHDSTSPGYRWVTNAAPSHLGWQLAQLRAVCEIITATVRAGAGNGPLTAFSPPSAHG